MAEAGAGQGAGDGAGATGSDGTGAGATGAGGAGAPAAFDWNTGITDEGVRTWVTAKGFKDPAALAQTALNQEKLLGVPADQIVRLPKDDKPESWAPVYEKMGRPKEAKDYGLPVPEGDKSGFHEVAANWFHEFGVSGKAARGVAEKWNAYVVDETRKAADVRAAAEVEAGKALKTDWGPKFDDNVKVVDAAAKTFGMTEDQLRALKEVMGPSGAMKFMHSIGSKLGVEGDFVTGDGKPGATSFSTPEAAKARIAALREDKSFVKRFATGDSEARAEMKKLHQLAYPGDTVL
ncbi:MAG: hypothetical protein Q8R92_16755 [Deltaproteobacteria bacterium]|nr:hypothetical protein [Deltaproteobacteria bacterium]